MTAQMEKMSAFVVQEVLVIFGYSLLFAHFHSVRVVRIIDITTRDKDSL